MVREEGFFIVPSFSEGRNEETHFFKSTFSMFFAGLVFIFALLSLFFVWKVVKFLLMIFINCLFATNEMIGGFVCNSCVREIQPSSDGQQTSLAEKIRSFAVKYSWKTSFVKLGIFKSEPLVLDLCRGGPNCPGPDKSIKFLLIRGDVDKCLFCNLVVRPCGSCDGVRMCEFRERPTIQTILPSYDEAVRGQLVQDVV